MPNKQKFNWDKCAPPEGWKPSTYYVVRVKFSAQNIEHKAILYTGFWDNKRNEPGGYSTIFNATYEDGQMSVREVHSLRVISEITDMADAR